MADSKGRISQLAFQGFSGALFSLAIIAAIGRTVIRLRAHKKLGLDDAFMLFACLCLTAATVLLYKSAAILFLEEKLRLNPAAALSLVTPQFITNLLWFQKVTYAYLALMWTVIFAVKASFLCLFQALINRLRSLTLYWRFVAVLTGLVYGFCVCDVFIPCPRFNLSALTCAQGSEFIKTLSLSAVIITLDIVTDIMIILIPVRLLWEVRINPLQKLALGVSLCLSVCMIIVAIIRISGLRAVGTSIDLVWQIFWQYMEGCTAVLMVSLTAFRSFFVQQESQRAEKEKERNARASPSPSPSPGFSASSPRKLWEKVRQEWEGDWSTSTSGSGSGSGLDDDTELGIGAGVGVVVVGPGGVQGEAQAQAKRNRNWNRYRLPSVPSATLTGLRSFVRGGGGGGGIRKNNRDQESELCDEI